MPSNGKGSTAAPRLAAAERRRGLAARAAAAASSRPAARVEPDVYLRLTWKCEVGAQLGLKRLIWC